MLIVNQGKDRIINLDNITLIYYSEYNTLGELKPSILYYFNKEEKHLGTYSSIERCKEILKEIAEAYNAIETSKLYAKSGTYSDYYRESFIYYMPEE